MLSTVEYQGDLRTSAQHERSGNTLITDAPTDNQGRGEAFSPTDLVATSLASCMLTIMGIKARENDWDITGSRAEIIKGMAADPRRIQRIAVRMHMTNATGLSEKQQQLLERAAKSCPVAKSLHPDIEQDIIFEW